MDARERRDHTFRVAFIIACWAIAVTLFVVNLLWR
jgi:hypothetical protein